MRVRKTIFTKEIITADEMGQASDPITRVAAMAVVKNPLAGVNQDDLTLLFDVSAQLGLSLTKELVHMLGAPLSAMAKPLLSGLRVRWNMEPHCCTLHLANRCGQPSVVANP